jgi:succinate dehydrogenase (ubiquinone) cytochrome b560 subunit
MKNTLSPHVTIYKFPITAISSITNRITGVYLSSVFIFCGFSHLSNINLYKEYENLDRNYKRLINYSFIFPLNFHTLGGIRHFIWDKYPKYLQNNLVKKSSLGLFATSIIFTPINEYILENLW